MARLLNGGRAAVSRTVRARTRGFTLIEMLIGVAIGTVLTVVAVPVITAEVQVLRLSSAVTAAAQSIQAARFQAIQNGYPYNITFTPSTFTYQVANEVPPATTFSNVGTAVPLSGTILTLNASTVLQFAPNGVVTCTTCGTGMAVNGAVMTITYAGHTATISISSVGYVSTSTT
jgi:prepilin-type N-terminal cleavage/methylation domain-containing protein